jgi:hypothetical protein
LELIKQDRVVVQQEVLFGEILIQRRPPEPDGPEPDGPRANPSRA